MRYKYVYFPPKMLRSFFA